MRDKDLKRELQEYAGDPDFVKKDEFIRSIKKNSAGKPVNLFTMILVHARYIRAYIWLLSLCILAFAISVNDGIFIDKIKALSDFMPFFAGLGIIEAFRARVNKMNELEKVTVFSGKGVFFAKATAVCFVQFITIILASVLLRLSLGAGILYSSMQILIPFLITNILCFIVERTSFGRENEWSCLGVAAAVFLVKRITLGGLDMFFYLDMWVVFVITIVLLAIQIYEIVKTVKLEEKLSWN